MGIYDFIEYLKKISLPDNWDLKDLKIEFKKDNKNNYSQWVVIDYDNKTKDFCIISEKGVSYPSLKENEMIKGLLDMIKKVDKK